MNIVSTPVQTSSIPRLSLKKRFITLKLYAAKIMQGESNSKSGKRSFTRLDIAEPPLILYKDNASEWKENLFSVSRTQLILYKGTDYFFQNIFFNVKILSFSHNALSAAVRRLHLCVLSSIFMHA